MNKFQFIFFIFIFPISFDQRKKTQKNFMRFARFVLSRVAFSKLSIVYLNVKQS